MLTVNHLSISFGGVKAVQDVSFAVEKGKVHAVIGPNGAGKTTMFNLLSGIYTPNSGEVMFQGENVAAMPPEQLARRGMSRTFQNLQVCMNMSAIENVMVGAHLKLNRSMFQAMCRLPGLRRRDAACRREAAGLMHFVGVGSYVGAHAGQMPYGALKRLEIARALAASPCMLLLDEPAAGLNNTETAEIEMLIRKIADTGVTVLLVEHDMKLVTSISDRILVMDHGRKLAEGTPREICANPEVVAAYLGASVTAGAMQ
jgi:branched-chain amino acid transport system ATP-binding protein